MLFRSLPYITQVAVGKLVCLGVFGNDYDTPDGTCVRDYIHVVDLADGHVKALDKLSKEQGGVWIYNLGTGVGYSVLDVINAFEEANNLKIKAMPSFRISGIEVYPHERMCIGKENGPKWGLLLDKTLISASITQFPEMYTITAIE